MSRHRHDKTGSEGSAGSRTGTRTTRVTKRVADVPSKTPRARSLRGAASREHARRHIDRLYEVSRLFSDFTTIEATVAEVIELVTQALPLRSVILIEESQERPRMTAWHAKGADPAQQAKAEEVAREGYAYLVPEGKSHQRELDVTRRSSTFLDHPPAGHKAIPRSPKDFLLLPLVTDHLPIAGALQIELASAMDAIDLAFMNGVALQLAVALDRHTAWTTEVELRARAEGLAIQNAHLYEDALTAINSRDRFIGDASHELLSPITALDLQVKMLLTRREGPARSPEQLEHAHALIHRQTARLVTLINRMLDATRAAAGHLSLDLEDDVDIADLFRDAAERLTIEAAQAGSTITVEAAPEVLGCWDRFRLEQVATNLLTNAIKYGNGKAIEVQAGRRRSNAWVSVRDRGLGIARQDLERIFERFSRAGEVHRQPGLGLGLYITRQIVEQHGGTIRVESTLAAGSVFTVELPLLPSRSKSSDPDSPETPPPAREPAGKGGGGGLRR